MYHFVFILCTLCPPVIQCLAWLYVCLEKVQVFVTQLRKGWIVEEPGESSATLLGSLTTTGPTLCVRLENAVKKSDIHEALCSHTAQNCKLVFGERDHFQWELRTRLNPVQEGPLAMGGSRVKVSSKIFIFL